MHWSEVWHGNSPGARLARTALTPLSWLYAGSWEAYLAVYKIGLKKPQELHRPVICVGNLVAGGTGKSPITLYVAGLLQELGRKVVIGCSGYGSAHSEGATLAPAGELDAAELGDEPAMFRWLAPEIPLIVGRGRLAAALLCHAEYPDSVLLMDDGFQHLPVRKHVTILLDPPSDNHRCLPAGPYREPRRHRSRADLVMPNSFRPRMEISALQTPLGGTIAFDTVSRVNALCALGNPDRFLKDIEGLGLAVESAKVLADHDRLDMGNLLDSLNPDLPLVVTAKDWVKLRRRADIGSREILVARQQARIEPEDEFRAWLAQKLDELSIKQSAS